MKIDILQIPTTFLSQCSEYSSGTSEPCLGKALSGDVHPRLPDQGPCASLSTVWRTVATCSVSPSSIVMAQVNLRLLQHQFTIGDSIEQTQHADQDGAVYDETQRGRNQVATAHDA